MSLLDTLYAIDAAPRGGARLARLADLDSPELREYLRAALDPQVTYGMRKLPAPAHPECPAAAKERTSEGWWADLKWMLKELSARRLTGARAQHAVAYFLGGCSPRELPWTERVIRQDLRLDVGAKEVNKVMPPGLSGPVVPVFGCPLADKYTSVKSYEGDWLVMPKLDGARCVAYLESEGGQVRLYSRTGKEWGNFPGVLGALEELNQTRTWRRAEDIVLDGEVVAVVDGRIDFQEVQRVLFAEGGATSSVLQYHVFDAATRADWEAQRDVPYSERHLAAREVVTPSVALDVVAAHRVANPSREDLEEWCARYTDRGYEGVMLRRADSGIRLRRTRDLLKVKTFYDAEATVIGVVEGRGRFAGLMGAMALVTDAGVPFELGTGFTDLQRLEYLVTPPVGQRASYKYRMLTRDGVPFHTSFRGIRHQDDA